MYELQLLNKVLETRKFTDLARYGVKENDFREYPNTYRFIRDYYKKFNRLPSIETVVMENAEEEFAYREVTEDISFLAERLKAHNLKRDVALLIQNEAPTVFNSFDGIQFTGWMRDKLDDLLVDANLGAVSHDFSLNAKDRLKAYYQRAAGEKRIWHSDLEKLDKTLGGFVAGDYVAVIAETGQGKSWISRRVLALPAWLDGANVIDYCLEMSHDKMEPRLDAMISAMLGMHKDGGFNTRGLIFGNLMEPEFQQYRDYCLNFENLIKGAGKYILRTFEDIDEVSLDTIEADIDQYEADIIIIDPIYYMKMARNRDNKTGGAAEQTSRQLRKLFGRKKVVGFVVAQAELEKKDKDVEVKAPTIAATKTTKAIVEDAAIVLSFAYEGELGMIRVGKGRDGGKDTEISVRVNFDRGMLMEDNGEGYF